VREFNGFYGFINIAYTRGGGRRNFKGHAIMKDADRFTGILKVSLVVLTGLLLARLSWLAWPDLIVDYGREVYVPWQLSGGSVLYRDIAYFYGPLSAYWNAILFGVFGASIFVMEMFNLLVIAVMAFIIYRLFDMEGDNLSSVVVPAAFLILFAFAKYFPMGSYNYVAPYSHELVHGTFLSFLAIYMLRGHMKGDRLVWVFASGFFAGLVALTKLEVTLAVVAALVSGLVLVAAVKRPSARRAVKMAGVFVAGLALPVVAFIAYLSLHMGAGQAARGVFSSWIIVATTDISTISFYKSMMGSDNLAANIRVILTSSAWYLTLLLPLAVNWLLRGSRLRKYGAAASFIVTAGLLAFFFNSVQWPLLFRPLPFFAAAGVACFAMRALRGGAAAERDVPLFALSVFALVMLLKIIFTSRIDGYGFVLGMPATLLAIYLLLTAAPAFLRKRWGYGAIFRYSVLAGVIALMAWHLKHTVNYYSPMTYVVGSGGDRIMTYENSGGGKGVNILVEQLGRMMGPDDGLVVMPEGALINYLARKVNPTGFVTFLPTDPLIFGESTMIDRLEKSSPAYIIFISRDTSEYGYHYLGQDYGFDIFNFVMERYEPVLKIGSSAFMEKSVGMGQPLGMLVYRRIDGGR